MTGIGDICGDRIGCRVDLFIGNPVSLTSDDSSAKELFSCDAPAASCCSAVTSA